LDGHFWLGMMVILTSGMLNGGFAFPMKYSRRWRWENTWLVFSFVAVLVLPWILAISFVPHLGQLYRGVPGRALLIPLIFGFLWGIAQVTFGLSIHAVGMAVAIAVVSGLACLSGALVPLLVLSPADLFLPRGILLLLSLPILLVGLLYYAVAGRRRERERSQTEPHQPRRAGQRSFMAGLAICIFTGVFASNFNLGFALSGDIVREGQSLGSNPVTATYAVWALVFAAGFIPNLLYCIYLLIRSRTWGLFRQGMAKETALGVSMALLWVGGVFGYGTGASMMGRYGTSVGFTLFMASSILSSNVLGLLAGEWRGASPLTRRRLAFGISMILASVAVLNLGGLF